MIFLEKSQKLVCILCVILIEYIIAWQIFHSFLKIEVFCESLQGKSKEVAMVQIACRAALR